MHHLQACRGTVCRAPTRRASQGLSPGDTITIMAYKDLREFIAKLEQSGQLHRVKIEVDPELEITEITDRVTKAGGPALLFEKVKGSNIPLLINAMGSYERMSMALGGRSLDEIAHEIEELSLAVDQEVAEAVQFAQDSPLPDGGSVLAYLYS